MKLHRRVLGMPATGRVSRLAERATDAVLKSQALGVNVQRGFVTVQAGGRLPTRRRPPRRPCNRPSGKASARFATGPGNGRGQFCVSPGRTLVPTAFETRAPRSRQALAGADQQHHLQLGHSDDGVMLTHVRLDMNPGDKPLLKLKLPTGAEFWFAFVNQAGVWPWREDDQILIALDQRFGGLTTLPVEFFYSSRIGASSQRELDLALQAPKFDLPLENITWRVSLGEKWKVKNWSGSLQLQSMEIAAQNGALDLETYLQTEAASQQQRTRVAENLLAAGNTALEKGDPQQARVPSRVWARHMTPPLTRTLACSSTTSSCSRR